MDRIKRQAAILTSYCTNVEPGDDVLVYGPLHAEDLLVALHEAVGDRGGRVLFLGRHSRSTRAYLESADVEEIDTGRHKLAAVETADVVISIRGTENPHEISAVEEQRLDTFELKRREFRSAMQRTRGVATCYPDRASAQEAQMSYDEYRKFVLDAITIDWTDQRERQAILTERLEEATSVHLVGEGTDIEMDVGPMSSVNEAGRDNLPGGEVYTAPVVESVEGTITFDAPTVVRGREIHDLTLTFRNGRVEEVDASRGEETIERLLDTDEGARRVGELGIGMNPKIDRFTGKTLFDEKVCGTVHLALGEAHEEVVPESGERNRSNEHLDLIIDMRDDGELLLDGEPVLRSGQFCFEGAPCVETPEVEP